MKLAEKVISMVESRDTRRDAIWAMIKDANIPKYVQVHREGEYGDKDVHMIEVSHRAAGDYSYIGARDQRKRSVYARDGLSIRIMYYEKGDGRSHPYYGRPVKTLVINNPKSSKEISDKFEKLRKEMNFTDSEPYYMRKGK